MLILITISTVNATDNHTEILISTDQIDDSNSKDIENTHLASAKQDIPSLISNAKENDILLINPGTYNINNLKITKNITIQGKGNPRDIIFDGNKLSSIILIRDKNVHVKFNNITFINGLTDHFGGAISIETGNVYVDNCIFKNNFALRNTNAGAISNYGTMDDRAYLLVNNSLFINNYANHDGGAITTCYAKSDILNSIFINNTAHRDGGAIRVSIYGYCNTEDCIFMYNRADEWGGAFYSWACTSYINRCIFLNNTAGTNGGSVMISGNISLTNSIIVNNTGEETGGSIFISQPMFKAITWMEINNNLITNNSSPYGKEIFISWKTPQYLYTDFNDNDWGDEDPNDSSVIDPNNVTQRSKITSTIKSNLLNILNLNLLTKYSDLLGDYFPPNYLENIVKNSSKNSTNNENINMLDFNKTKHSEKPLVDSYSSNTKFTSNSTQNINKKAKSEIFINSTSSYGSNKKAYELNETGLNVIKTISPELTYFIIAFIIVFIALVIGYKKEKNKNK